LPIAPAAASLSDEALERRDDEMADAAPTPEEVALAVAHVQRFVDAIAPRTEMHGGVTDAMAVLARHVDAISRPRRGRRARVAAAPSAEAQEPDGPAPEAPPPRRAAPVTGRAGDVLVVSGHKAGDPERHADILQALGADAGPPYRVRWADGRESNVYMGPDMHIERRASRRR
jgi:hypothetical protein